MLRSWSNSVRRALPSCWRSTRMTSDPAAALILAGGDARRLGGRDKPLLDVGGVPILARLIATLREDTAATAISANGDPTRFAAFGLPVLPDGPFAGEGPLAGVLAGLDWAASVRAVTLLTVPGDTPFIPAGLAAALTPAPACAASHGRTHHLIALWPVACRDAAPRHAVRPRFPRRRPVHRQYPHACG